MQLLSAFVTTFNNEATLNECLSSVAWADEIVVLDSFSTDSTLAIARAHHCRVFQQEFRGYGPQKQDAMEHTTNRWVLLLDADEALTPPAQLLIQDLLKTEPSVSGYSLPRIEQMFWQFSHRGSRLNYFLRLFDKTQGHISDMPIHAAPVVNGRVEKIDAPFIHYGEPNIHTKVEKVNAYSSGLVQDKQAKGKRANPWIMVWYPPLFFLRIYLFKRNFMNGWAGFIASVVSAFYAFMKYAKLYEAHRLKQAEKEKSRH
jgi:glycosyltransferase involved in cell wall biosynthesis